MNAELYLSYIRARRTVGAFVQHLLYLAITIAITGALYHAAS